MTKRIYLAGRNRTFINLIALLALLSLLSFRFSNINREEKIPSILLKNMENPAKYILEKSRNPGSGKSRRSILSPSYPSPNRKSASSGSDPIRFVFYTNKKQVSLGEEVELTITAHYMAIHPGLLAAFSGSNAFSLKVIVPDGFIQTGGDYIDLIGTELSTHRKTVTYSLKGKFVSISSNPTFRLLRSHKDAGTDSKFVEKGKFQIHCQNSVESLANAGSLKGSRIAAESASLTGCYIIRSKKTGQLLQSLSGDVVEQRTANNQANQIWKAETVGTNQYRFTTQDGSGKSMQANSDSQGELIRVGTYTGTDLQKWTIQSDNNGSYRLSTTNGLTWDMRNYGAEPQLQLWGNLAEGFADQRLFTFESTGCPTTPPPAGSCTTLRNADSPSSLTGGLTYKYYQSIANNDWCSATGLSGQAVVSSGSVGTINLTPRQREDHFGFEFAGYIQVPADGQYTFFITSDDDSQLLIGGQLIAADRGCHGINSTGQEPSGSICLRAGYHPIQILYSQGTEGLGLKTFWQGPTFAKQEIPAGALFRSGSATVACDFVVSATAPATANCSSAIILNAPCTGVNCDGVSYQWSTGQNGQSVNITAAGNNGTTTYAVTASKAGCDNKIAQTSVTVTSCPNSTNVATKTFMMTSIVGEEWSDGKDYGTRKYVNLPNRNIPMDPSLKVERIENITKIMDYWQKLGGTHVSMPMNWDDTEINPGVFEFRHWDRIFIEAANHGLKVNINLMPLVNFWDASLEHRTSASWRYDESDAVRKPVKDAMGNAIRDNGVLRTEPVPHFMSYSSSRMNNYRRWLNGVANYLANHTSQIGYVAVVTNELKEANYYLNANTDFHPAALNAWS
ncbi:MAG: hypothetical protein EOP49_16000, partial [Sphingobacteriales bacterium]